MFMTREPHTPIRDIDFITTNEMNRLLYDRNPPDSLDVLLSPAQNISELIELQVQTTPQRIAVRSPLCLTSTVLK